MPIQSPHFATPTSIITRLPLLPSSRTLLLRRRHSLHRLIAVLVLVCALGRRIGDFIHDLVQEIELFVFEDGLLEVRAEDAFGAAAARLVGGFGDETDHEELEGFGWAEC